MLARLIQFVHYYMSLSLANSFQIPCKLSDLSKFVEMLRERRLLVSSHSTLSMPLRASNDLVRRLKSETVLSSNTFTWRIQTNQSTETIPQHSTTFSIVRSSWYNSSPDHSHETSSDSELVKHLQGITKFRGGPISVAEYMEEVLTNPKAGFYINWNVFGAEGDFITSPEVSQMFGEGALKFKNFTKSLHIHMVECSPTLQKLQCSNLKCMPEENYSTDVEKGVISTLAS